MIRFQLDALKNSGKPSNDINIRLAEKKQILTECQTKSHIPKPSIIGDTNEWSCAHGQRERFAEKGPSLLLGCLWCIQAMSRLVWFLYLDVEEEVWKLDQ